MTDSEPVKVVQVADEADRRSSPSMESGREDGKLGEESAKAPEEDFSWMQADQISDETWYFPYEWDKTAKSADFGSDGYTASLTDWHELLQITAPDADCGMIYARGSFPDDPSSILARVQQEDHSGGKGTFGFQMLPESNFVFNGVNGQGLINSRWPYLRYRLDNRETESVKGAGHSVSVIGSYETLSFVKDHTIFQIVRVVAPVDDKKRANGPAANDLPKPDGAQQDVLGGGDSQPLGNTASKDVPGPKLKPKFVFRVGGRVRFACPCTIHRRDYLEVGYRVQSAANWVSCYSEDYSCTLRVRVFADGEPIDAIDRPESKMYFLEDGDPLCGNTSTKFEIPLDGSKPRVITIAYALETEIFAATKSAQLKQTMPSSDEVKKHLGIAQDSDETTEQIWSKIWQVGATDENNKTERRIVTTCVERILNVSSIPISLLGEQLEELIRRRSRRRSRLKRQHSPVIARPRTPTTEGSLGNPSTKSNFVSADKIVVAHGELLPNDIIVSNVAAVQNSSPFIEPPIRSGRQVTAADSLHTDDIPYKTRRRRRPEVTPELSPFEMDLKFRGSGLRHPSIAVINNFMSPEMDFVSTFWQIRFLVKVYNFLGTEPQRDEENLGLEESSGLLSSHQAYLAKIRDHVRAVLSWMIKIDISAIKSHPLVSSVFDDHSGKHGWPVEKSFNAFDTCFRVMTLWYVLHYAPDIPNGQMIGLLADNISILGWTGDFSILSPSQNSNLIETLLKWYRQNCFLQLRDFLGLRDNTQYNVQGEAERAVKLSAKRRTTDYDMYSTEDEYVDRLSFLAVEIFPAESFPLDTKSSKLSAQAELCSNYARNRLSQRTKTSKFHAGTRKSKSGRDRDSERAPSPWELELLSHHCLLMAAATQPEEVDIIRTTKEDCFEFLSSDYTFLPTWDASRTQMLSRWWTYDASSIVCATLVDLKQKERNVTFRLQSNTDEIKLMSSVEDPNRRRSFDLDGNAAKVTLTGETDRIAKLLEIQINLTNKQINLQNVIVQMLQKPPAMTNMTTTAALHAEFDWTKIKPERAQPYHPRAWVLSLEDTPDDFLDKQMEKVQLQSEIKKYLRRKNGNKDLPTRTWTISNIEKRILPEDLLYLSLFDISLDPNDTFSIQRLCGRADVISHWSDNEDIDDIDATISHSCIVDCLQLWSRYVDGDLKISNLEAPELAFEGFPSWIEKRLRDPIERKKALTRLHSKLLDVLNDSLVDKGVRHRLLFVQRFSRNLVEALIYIWHREALDTIDSYFIPSSRYANTKFEVWTTTITISHWEIKDSYLGARFDEERGAQLVIPVQQSISEGSRKAKKTHGTSQSLSYEEASSSIVITGDMHGLFWTCLIISSQTEDDQMEEYSAVSASALTLFINQQSSGRCLVFLLLLGRLCAQVAKEYQRIIDNMMDKLGLGDQVLMMGFKWEDRDQAVSKLQRMILCLEALRVFDNRLSSSLSSIKEARESMVREISDSKQESGRYREELDRGYKGIMEAFDRRYGDLSIMHINIEQKIEQISRLRDGISSVTNVEDSRAAIKQNNNIRVLTYITIAYLPLGYIAALFSISDNSVVGSPGPGAFAWMTMLSLLLTLIGAFSIEPIQERWSKYQQDNAEEKLKNMTSVGAGTKRSIVIGEHKSESEGKVLSSPFQREKGTQKGRMVTVDEEETAADSPEGKKRKLRSKFRGLRLRVGKKSDEEATVEGVNGVAIIERGSGIETTDFL